jgi:hypothetical protein
MRRKLMWFLIAVIAIVAAGAFASSLLATPANPPLFTNTQIWKATFDELDLKNQTIPAFWQSRLKTKGLSDVYVVSNLWKPGGTTGWHTHPGASLIIVTKGTITAYEGDDPACAPHLYSQGMGFVDPGDGHLHVLRNEDPINEASTVAVQIIPASATRRIDADHPDNCPSSVN